MMYDLFGMKIDGIFSLILCTDMSLYEPCVAN